jgi:hypothetical protein
LTFERHVNIFGCCLIYWQVFDARYNETELNRSTSLRKARAEFAEDKAQLSALLKRLELERVEESKTIVLEREEWRNNGNFLKRNLSAVTSKAEICELQLNTTIENTTKQSMLSDERIKVMKQNCTSTIRDLTRTASKV